MIGRSDDQLPPFGSGFSSFSHGYVAQPGLSKTYVENDLAVIGSLARGGDVGEVDLIYIPVPEPSAIVILGLALLTAPAMRLCTRRSA